MEPGVEAIGIPERGQITPGADERVLDGVLRLFRVPEDEPGGGVQPGDRGACQHGEGVMVASPRSLHEVSLHLAPRRWRGRLAALSEYGDDDARRMVPAMAAAPPRRPGIIERPVPPAAEVRRRVKIHEADAKSLLVAQGLPVPAWEVARTPTQARAAAVRFLADPGERDPQGRDQGAGARRRPGQGRRRPARRHGRRGRGRRGADPRARDQGPARPAGARRRRRPRSSRSTTSRSCSTGRPSG